MTEAEHAAFYKGEMEKYKRWCVESGVFDISRLAKGKGDLRSRVVYDDEAQGVRIIWEQRVRGSTTDTLNPQKETDRWVPL